MNSLPGPEGQGPRRKWPGARPFAAASILLSALTPADDALAGQGIVLLCSVERAPDPSFEAAFCSELGRSLEQDLRLAVTRASAAGRAVQVRMWVRSPSAADVELTEGRTDGRTFTGGERSESILRSMDQPLQPVSARTLVRPIGLLLKLV